MADVIEASQRGPGHRRLLGAVVRAVQDADPGAGEGRHRGQGQGPAGQDRRRPEPADRGADAGAVDPGGLRLRRRPAGRRLHGRAVAGADQGLRRPADRDVRRQRRPRGGAGAWPRRCWREGAVADAAQTFAAILAEDEANVAALAGLARAHLALGELEPGARDPGAGARRQGERPGAPRGAGAGRARRGERRGRRHRRATAAAVERDPDDHQARFDLALALIAEGDREGAVDALARALPPRPRVERRRRQGAALQALRQPRPEERGWRRRGGGGSAR